MKTVLAAVLVGLFFWAVVVGATVLLINFLESAPHLVVPLSLATCIVLFVSLVQFYGGK